MELMILKLNVKEGIFHVGFNRHEWLAFDKEEDFYEFLKIIRIENRSIFEEFENQNKYAIAFIDLKTAKAVDKKFGFEGSFVEAFKERRVK